MTEQPELFPLTEEPEEEEPYSPVCLCCGNPATNMKVLLDILVPHCDECGSMRFEKRDGRFVFTCDTHGDEVPLEIEDSTVEWYRSRSKKTGQKYRQSYPVKTRDGRQVMMLDFPDPVSGLYIDDSKGAE